jgi:hypothetical protein
LTPAGSVDRHADTVRHADRFRLFVPSDPAAAEPAEQRLLTSTEEGCMRAGVRKQSIPERGETANTQDFFNRVRANGYPATSTRIAPPKNKAREPNVPQDDLFAKRATPTVCRDFEARRALHRCVFRLIRPLRLVARATFACPWSPFRLGRDRSADCWADEIWQPSEH